MNNKPLYICKSIAELQKKAEMNKIELWNVKSSCQLLDKLFEKFEKAYLDQDEELAFIYINRFLFLFAEIRKSFKKDAVYINALFNSKKIDLAFDRATNLKISLKARYEEAVQKIDELPKEPVKLLNHSAKGVITAVDLYKGIKNMENILIVDTRPTHEFLSCHINYTQLVNIPANELKPGCSIVDVNKLLEIRNNTQELNVWSKRQSFSLVVLVAWGKNNDESINLVKDAIYKWDAEGSITEPLILDGGVHSFSTHYPTMVTDSKYRGPSETRKDDIVPENIQYPDWDHIESEKKRIKDSKKLKETKKSEEQKEINGIDLENKFNQMKIANNTIQINRALKPPVSLNEDLKPSIVVDRSLKPFKTRDKDDDGTVTNDQPIKPANKVSTPLELGLVSENEKPSVSLDRSLKPNVLRVLNIDNSQVKFGPKKDLESPDITSIASSPSEIPRLSNNSRTNQDRTNFTAKGGAKSIPPPTETTIESRKTDLPVWIVKMFDNKTNDYYYLDRRNNKKFRVLPEELLEDSKENPMLQDHVESLIDHSSNTKPILKPTASGTSLKRSTSQPNLSEDANSQHKQPPNSDSTLATQTSRQLDPPTLNRQYKPSNVKTFTEFSASRLNNFNPSYRTVTPGLTGLRNMGNTCYMNSVVQALSNTKFLTNYILTNNYRHDINRDNPLGYGGEIVSEFANLTTALWTGTYREVSPADFKRMIDGKNEMFRGSEQHDSQEFLLFLLDGLHEDLNRGSKHAKVTNPPNDEQQTDSNRAQLSWKTHVAVNDSVIVRIFQGQYRSKVTCDHCQVSSVTFDAFMYLSLPLVPNHNRCTLEDCLKLFLAEERMTGASQWFCPKCKTNRNAKKKIDIWKLPPYLLIHLKRFSCTGQYRQKLNTFVDFPMESFSLVDILKHTKQTQTHDTYHLYAVSNHHGNMESGHYTSFCKNMTENEWYNYDDDVVTKIKDSEVKTPSAYILFYESYNLKQAGYKN